jgi:hypothetical protein
MEIKLLNYSSQNIDATAFYTKERDSFLDETKDTNKAEVVRATF